MLTFGEMRHDGPAGEAGLRARGALRVALAGLIAGSMLLVPAVAGAETQDPKSGQAAATPPSGDGPKKVSPYADANKRHIDPATGRHEHTMKRAASGRVQGAPVRRKH